MNYWSLKLLLIDRVRFEMVREGMVVLNVDEIDGGIRLLLILILVGVLLVFKMIIIFIVNFFWLV